MTKSIWIAPLLLAIVGCNTAEPPKPVVEMPKDTSRVEPGAVDPDAPEEYTTTESGLKYRIRRKADGAKPEPDSVIRLHYRGTLANGQIFDSSYGKTGQAAVFPLGTLIKGWQEGLLLTGEGGMIELEIPPELGYGNKVTGPIPPNSTLHFIVELIEIMKYNPPPGSGVKAPAAPDQPVSPH